MSILDYFKVPNEVHMTKPPCEADFSLDSGLGSLSLLEPEDDPEIILKEGHFGVPENDLQSFSSQSHKMTINSVEDYTIADEIEEINDNIKDDVDEVGYEEQIEDDRWRHLLFLRKQLHTDEVCIKNVDTPSLPLHHTDGKNVNNVPTRLELTSHCKYSEDSTSGDSVSNNRSVVSSKIKTRRDTNISVEETSINKLLEHCKNIKKAVQQGKIREKIYHAIILHAEQIMELYLKIQNLNSERVKLAREADLIRDDFSIIERDSLTTYTNFQILLQNFSRR